MRKPRQRTFAACVVWDAIFPAWRMYPFWRSLLPGFERLSVGGSFLGLLESILLGFWAALVFVPVYNLASRLPLIPVPHKRTRIGSGRRSITLAIWGGRWRETAGTGR